MTAVAELEQRQWERGALLAAGGPADIATDGERLWWGWGSLAWCGAESACRA